MYSTTRVKKIINNLNNLSNTTGLTNEQVTWVKDKVSLVEQWKDIAVVKLTAIDLRLDAIEKKAVQFQTALASLTARVKALEDKLK